MHRVHNDSLNFVKIKILIFFYFCFILNYILLFILNYIIIIVTQLYIFLYRIKCTFGFGYKISLIEITGDKFLDQGGR